MTRIQPPRKDSARSVFRHPQVNLYVKDVVASVSFYTDLFGFTETFRTPKSGTPVHVELRLGHLILGLASIESLRRIHGLAGGEGPPKGEVVLWTDDVDKAFARLIAKGVRTLTAPHDFTGSLRGAWVADPDDNPVQIVSKHSERHP